MARPLLVNLVPRFYDATNGDVLVDGVNVKDYDVDTLRSKIGVVLQKSELFSGICCGKYPLGL